MSDRVAQSLEPTTDIAAELEPGRTSMLAALRYRDFRLFWFGLLVSNIGTWMQMFGQGWLVVQLAVRDGAPQLAPFYLGLVGLARAVPGLGLGLFAGAVADRADRRQLLMVTQTTAGLLALLLATLTASDTITIWVIVLISACSSAVFSFDAPTRQSMVPRLVPRQDLMSAIGLNQAGFNGPAIVGPALGGLLIGVTGVAGLFFVNAASYVAVVTALILMRPYPTPIPKHPTSMRQSVVDGVRYVRGDPVIRWVIVLAITASFLARPYIFLLPAVAQNVLHVGATELSWLMSSTGVGSLAGALLVANLGGVQRRGRLFIFATAGLGLTLALFALQRDLFAAVVAALLLGLTTIVFNGIANTILQTSSHEHMQGRVLSVMTMVFMGVMPLGQLALGALGSVFDVDTVLFVGGVVVAGAALYAMLRVSSIRRLVSTRRPHYHPHTRGAPSPAE